MGIYSNGAVYGVSFTLYDNILFEKTYDHTMISEEIQHVKDFYETLSTETKELLTIRMYTPCSTTYATSSDIIMCWFPTNTTLLERLFNSVV